MLQDGRCESVRSRSSHRPYTRSDLSKPVEQVARLASLFKGSLWLSSQWLDTSALRILVRKLEDIATRQFGATSSYREFWYCARKTYRPVLIPNGWTCMNRVVLVIQVELSSVICQRPSYPWTQRFSFGFQPQLDRLPADHSLHP